MNLTSVLNLAEFTNQSPVHYFQFLSRRKVEVGEVRLQQRKQVVRREKASLVSALKLLLDLN